MWSTGMWRHRDDTADCWRVLLWTRIPESRYPAKWGWLLKEAGNERQESLSHGKIGYRFERGNIAHSFLQCEQSHELRSWQDMTLSSVESVDDLSITEDAKAVIGLSFLNELAGDDVFIELPNTEKGSIRLQWRSFIDGRVSVDNFQRVCMELKMQSS